MTPAATLLCALPPGVPPPVLRDAVRISAPLPAAQHGAPTPQPDTVLLRDGRQYRGRILAADLHSLHLQVRPDPDQPPAILRIPLGSVADTRFATATGPGLQGDPVLLASLWARQAQFIHVPGSPAPALGLRHAESLLDSRSAASAKNALDLLTFIEKSAWNPGARLGARRMRLRAMVASHQLEAAATEAREILHPTATPPPDSPPESRALTAEALLVAALDATARLEALEHEHPRWNRDERIRPRREELFHSALDSFLDSALQPAPDPSTSSRALWGAARLYLHARNPEAAAACLGDILLLYPSSTVAGLARTALDARRTAGTLPPLPSLSIPNTP